MTNNSIFTRVLALVLCFIMVAGMMTSCFQEAEPNQGVSTETPSGSVTTPSGTTKPDTDTTTTTGDSANNDPIEDPVDPNEIYSGSTTLSMDDLIYGTLANNVFIGDENGVAAMIPADVKVEAGASALALSVTKVEEEALGDTLSNLDVHVSGIALDNTVPMTVMLGAILPIGLANTELKLYHVENGTPVLMMRVDSAADFAIHNQYVYDAETGNVTIYVASFSVFTAVQTTADVWDGEAKADSFASGSGTEEDPYIIETAAQLIYFRNEVDGGNKFEGQFIKLATDIDLNDKLFNPIGGGWAYNNGKTFNGTFDGGNHTIYNLRVNGWELDETGDKHSGTSNGAGLFSSLHNATIKNLAVVGSELIVETTSIGIIAGCAQGQCTFENIVVSDATLGNYQMRNGGIVGDIYVIASDNVPEGAYSHTFKNIVVDSSVKLSSMWGDFDTGNGGVIGGKYGSTTKVLMQNVIVAAELDVFSDVTAAYQWYAYRRCGMLIGYTGQNSPKQATNAAADFLKCENVSVYYGDWTNYTYYQFNEQDSSTGQRYPWVRAEESLYNPAFSNVRYGVPTFDGVKVSDMDADTLNAKKSGFAAITFNQLYGGGQGVYGTNEHANVTIHNNLANAKTIYILNNANWENLKLQYWFRNGEDTWTTNIDGINMSGMYLSSYNVYKIDLPSYVDGFRIVADNENSVEFTLADLEDGETYTVSGETHEHDFGDSNKCECGAYKIQKWELVTDANDLAVDDQIIIVAVDANYAIGINQAENNRTGFAIVRNTDGTITITDNVQVLTLVSGTTNGTFGLYTGTGYLYAATAGSNHLKTQATNNVNGDWTITITDGVASIIAKGSSNRNVMQYNPNQGSPIFSCYASASQKAIAIYKLSASEEIMEAHNCNDYAVGTNCEDNATCTICGEIIENSALGHNYESVVTEATCTKGGYTTHTCSRCGDDYVTDETDALGHSFDGDSCSICGEAKPTVGGTKTYVFSEYTAGEQYGKDEEHTLDENTIILTNNCHFTTQLRIYSSSTYNGYAIIKSVNPITNIGFNAGDNADTIVIYGSNDNGATWTEVARVAVKSAYADYTVELTTAYTWIKLDVDGSKQVRLASITLTTGEPCEHSYETQVTAPTCTEDGYTTYTCTECGYSYTDNTVTATGHQNTTTTTVDATCTVAGSITVTCNDCGAPVSTKEIPALGHTTDNGTCERCDETIGGTTTEPEHTCESICETCGGCTDATCEENACANKCKGHEPTWTLVTDASTLQAGDKIIIVAKDYNYALSTTQNTNNRGQIAITKDGSTLTIADGVQIITLEAGTVDETFAFNTGSGYLYAASSSANHLKTQTTNDDNGSWKITIAADGTATIVAQGSYSRNTMQYNQSSSLFACYASATQKAIAIYKQVGGSEGGETTCEHTNATSEVTQQATCVSTGVITYTCECGELWTEEIAINSENHVKTTGTCDCGVTLGGGSTAPQPETFTADFNTVTNTSTSYVKNTTTSGWVATNCAVIKGGTSNSNPQFVALGDANNRGFVLNGKTSAKGSIISPTLTNGISKITFSYTNIFSESKGVDITIVIKQNGATVASKQLDNNSVTQYQAYEFSWDLSAEGVAITGDFTIEIINNSPSNSTSNKDRVAIWNLQWTNNPTN